MPRIADNREDARLVTLDVWQDGSGIFDTPATLTSFVTENGIGAVNIDPGASAADAFRATKAVVDPLRGAGVRVRFLYSHDRDPLGNYADMLVSHRDELAIDTLVDHSVLTDASRTAMSRRLDATRAAGLEYSAFVPVGPATGGEIGDETRHWAISTLDDPVLISVSSCSVGGDGGEAEALEPYLAFGDGLVESHQRDAGFLRVAILAGPGSAPGQQACAREFRGHELALFVQELDRWCRSHKSYGGIVVETKHAAASAGHD